jgi:hypothetical protein
VESLLISHKTHREEGESVEESTAIAVVIRQDICSGAELGQSRQTAKEGSRMHFGKTRKVVFSKQLLGGCEVKPMALSGFCSGYEGVTARAESTRLDEL